MRIVIWVEKFLPHIGGVERSLMLMLPVLQERGIEAIIITSQFEPWLAEEDQWQGISIYRFNFANAFSNGDTGTWLRQQKRLSKLIDGYRPALAHITSIGAGMVAFLPIVKQRAIPLIVSLVNMELQPQIAYAPNAAIGKTLLTADWVTTVSRAILEQTIHHLPDLTERISVLYSGYPVPNIEPTALADPPRLLLIGRLVPQKGGDLAIAAFAKIAHCYPDARLIIAGDGPEREKWKMLAEPLGEQVEFLGWISPEAVFSQYNQATITLLPSRHEGLPFVAIEASFMARPIIASAIPGMTEIVIDGKTGLLVEPEDIEALANAMAYLIDHHDEATTMGLTAREWVKQSFSLQHHVDEHEALYKRVVGVRQTQP